MQLPPDFSTQMHNLLGSETTTFLGALQETLPVSVRFNRGKACENRQLLFEKSAPVPWCDSGCYLPSRPMFTLDPFLHAGVYYVQEASSMFLAHLVNHLFPETAVMCLDLCAAPGGKSTLLADFLPGGSLLVSNEVIRSRTAILCENLTKWGNPNVAVTGNDPKDFAALPAFFDVVLIDAPCSGEGMFRKDPSAIDEWSPAAVRLCSERQRRIVADAWPALKAGGILFYSTCTYNRMENEENVRWMMDTLGAELVQVPVPAAWNITESDGGYRFYPHKTKGEGFFVSALRKTGDAGQTSAFKIPKQSKAAQRNSNPVPKEIEKYVQGEFVLKQMQEKIIALPARYEKELALLHRHLHVWQAGTSVAEVKGKDVIPDIALALSTALNKAAFTTAGVDLHTAQRYLHRENIYLPDTAAGFVLITHQHQPLGFVKNLGTRTNNLYPKEWRIRMSVQ